MSKVMGQCLPGPIFCLAFLFLSTDWPVILDSFIIVFRLPEAESSQMFIPFLSVRLFLFSQLTHTVTRSIYALIDWLIYWLIDRLIDWLIDLIWLVDWLIWLVGPVFYYRMFASPRLHWMYRHLFWRRTRTLHNLILWFFYFIYSQKFSKFSVCRTWISQL